LPRAAARRYALAPIVAGNDGTLTAPATSRVRLIPTGKFYELQISLGDGNAVVAVLAKAAIKITRETKA
jgi:hypothetical protein